jgi:CRISPR/Cas system-associated exonuclease Cas4 (RecB family)
LSLKSQTSRSKEFNRIREAAQKKHAGFTPGQRLEQLQEMRSPDKLGPVKVWSFSTLKDFEACKYRTYLSKVEKMPHPTPATNSPLVRGNRIHNEAEDFVKGETDTLSKDLQKFKTSLSRLKEQFQEGIVEVEQNWGFTADWDSVSWKDPLLWCRMKLDVLLFDGEDSAYVIDYKTGKKFGNEIKHTDQGLSYAIGTIMRYPQIKTVQTEFWYTDQGETLKKLFNRNQLMLLVPHLEERAHRMTSCTSFEPSPSVPNCKWCPHRETNNCAYAEGL